MKTLRNGLYYQSDNQTREPIEWLVLEKADKKALLISKYGTRWTRTGYDKYNSDFYSYDYYAKTITGWGKINDCYISDTCGVRPAMWIDLDL